MRTSGRGEVPIADQLVSFCAPGSFAADQYRTLRLTVERLHKVSALRVLAVTSAGASDGKSVTTLNLAGALAQAPDARVLVVDADLRRPSIAEYLGIGPLKLPGLSEALQNVESDPLEFVRRMEPFNLSVLPAGTPQPTPFELLNSTRLEQVVAEARDRFDYVLLDTPPLVPFPDCRALGRCVDGYLVTVAAHKTPRRLVAEALNLLDVAKVIGVVFNGDNQPRSRHYDGYYYYSDTPDSGHRKRSW